MSLLTKLTTIWAKVETTARVDATPDGTNDAVRCAEVEIDPEVDPIEQPEIGITLSPNQDLSGLQRVNLNIKTALIASGSAGVAVNGLKALLQSAGLGETIVGSTSTTYAPVDTGFKTASIYANMHGVRHRCLGFVSDVKWEWVAGEIPWLNFEGKAIWESPSDQTFPTTHAPETTMPHILKNLTATIDSYAAVIRSFKGNLGNVISESPDYNGDYGIASFDIVDRKGEAEFEIEATTLAAKNWWAKLSADSIIPFSIVMGATAGNIITVTGYCKIRNIKWGDADGKRIHTLQVQLCKDSSGTAGSEFRIAKT